MSHITGSPAYDAGHFDRVGETDLDPPGSPGAALGPVWVEQHGAVGALDGLQDTVRYDGWERVRKWIAMKRHVVVASDSFNFDYAGNISSPGGAESYDVVTDRLVSRTDAGTTRSSVSVGSRSNSSPQTSSCQAMSPAFGPSKKPSIVTMFHMMSFRISTSRSVGTPGRVIAVS